MRKALVVPVLLIAMCASHASWSADALVQEVLEDMGYVEVDPNAIDTLIRSELAVASERYRRSNSILVEKTKNAGSGGTLSEYTQIVKIEDEDGDPILMGVAVSAEHLERLKTRHVQHQLVDGLEAYAEGMLLIGAVIDGKMVDSIFGTDSENPNLIGPARTADSLNDTGICKDFEIGDDKKDLKVGRFGQKFSVAAFLFGPSCMLEAMAARMNDYLDPDFELAARTESRDRSDIASEMALEDSYEIDGTRVAAYSWTDTAVATGASGSTPRFQQVDEDGMVTNLRKITVHIDLEHLTRRRIRIEGIMTKGGESRDFYLENEYGDFRYVDNTVLYEPYKETQRMGGILGPEERAQMQEAKQKLDEFERQMAAMPASQRRMMENMMGSQMDQFRQLANDGTVEIVVITKEIVINPDLGIGSGGGIIPAAQPESTQINLVQIIQGHLVTLGYKPGATSGELTRQTVVAITQYEAANGMTVTGQATPQLAGRLAAEVDAL